MSEIAALLGRVVAGKFAIEEHVGGGAMGEVFRARHIVLDTGFKGGRDVTVKAKAADGTTNTFRATVRIDTPQEVLYYKHGGILPYVLRSLLRATAAVG